MSKKKSALDRLVLPTRKMTGDQLAQQRHLAHRAGVIPAKTRDSARGGRSGARRTAINSGW